MSDDTAHDLRQTIADLQRELATRTAERDEGLARETAVAEVLQVITATSGDLGPVFDAMLERAMHLCEAAFGFLATYDGERFHQAAGRGLPPAFAQLLREPWSRGAATAALRVVQGEAFVHIADLLEDEGTRGGASTRRAIIELGGARTQLTVPMRKDNVLLGNFVIYRQEVRPFSEKQIALLQNFAAQAVIAMENARLISETREALEQQTATAEVLGVINSSPGDLGPVFDAVLENAMRLCQAAFGVLWTYGANGFRAASSRGAPPRYAEFLAKASHQPGPVTAHGRLLRGSRFEHIPDVAASEDYRRGDPFPRALVDLAGGHTILAVPLRRDDTFLGDIFLYRQEVRPFTDKQIGLLQTFAAQAVIAMENARLITETREALEQQTATAEVLQVISSSPGELTPVFDTMLERAVRLCEFDYASLWTYDGTAFHPRARHRVPERIWQYLQDHTPPAFARVVSGEHLVHVADVREDGRLHETNFGHDLRELGLDFVRSLLIVPMRKDNVLLGVIVAYRQEVRPFSEKQIALLQNFATQAVIAMENARLITETREALEQQTATAEVLGVINSSPRNLAPVFDAMLEKAMQLCDAAHGHLWVYDGERVDPVAVRGEAPVIELMRRVNDVRPIPVSPIGRILSGEEVVHIADVLNDGAYKSAEGFKELVDTGEIRTLLDIPLRKEGKLLGILAVYRKEVRPFSDQQIALLQNFAAQAVIAMDNARLITETREARDAAEKALGELKTAQASLIHAEKMASLGQLTAGIAHEIKNPLNFVNNFAGLSVELLDELKETVAPGVATLDDDTRAQIDETVEMLTSNLDKIAEHGKRADGIVKSMLEHSRGVAGERRAVDLSALTEEALNLAYHGARAQDQSFNITMERDLDRHLVPIEVVPQDMTRVLLNLIGNGFYAATKRSREAANGYRPVLKVTTCARGDAVEIRVRDNGVGISSEHRDKLFRPFFTTKPTGEGTGLGLSISYDIVTQLHGGTITVESEPGAFTEFTIRLPRH